MRIIYWVVTLLFLAFIVMGAVQELMQTAVWQKIMTDLGYPTYLNYILGFAKIAGAVAIIQWNYKTIKEWAYAGFTFDIVGAATSVYLAGLGIGNALFLLVFLIPLFISYGLWKKLDRTA